MTEQPVPRTEADRAYQDGPNTHRFPDYPYTTVHVYATVDVDGATHRFHVPEELVAVIEAALRNPESIPDTPSLREAARLAVARAVATIWRDDYLRFMDEAKPASTQWAIGTHPLNLVLAALDGETDPVHLGVTPDQLHAALAASIPTDLGDGRVSRKPRGTYWAAEWHSVNQLDGETRHLLHEGCVPVLFQTRREARAYINAKLGYIRDRPDLRAEPHGWRIPRAILVTVVSA